MGSLGLVGAPNTRDLGGLTTADGRRLRPGMLLRASALGRLSDQDVMALGKLDLALVIDLRHANEIAVAPPDRLPEPVPRTEHIPIFDPAHPVFTYISAILLGHDGAGYAGLRQQGTPAAMLAIYRWFVRDAGARGGFAAALRAIAGSGGRPVLFHCSAGKDRTGWLSAVLLELLGVDRSLIIEDYLATNGYARAVNVAIMDAMRSHGLAVDPDVLLPLFEARLEYLTAAYTEVEREFGGLDGYARTGLGIDDATREALRDAVLE
ncbi:MAG TPA: tyrosine-protein phosphatase [Kribbellaceae bacterium]|nr:tyrosine-protein phosphatase [Kribbellaceae bacterium]